MYACVYAYKYTYIFILKQLNGSNRIAKNILNFLDCLVKNIYIW